MSNRRLNIVADQNMVGVCELFEPYGEVTLVPGRSISPADLVEAHVLLVRSVTQVDRRLLEGSSIEFVGTATSGVDHIDRRYLSESGIQFASAVGCNAGAVVQYVLSAMCHLSPDWESKTVGIIGCGQVGNKLRQTLACLAVNYKVYDPFISSDALFHLSELNEVMDSDIVCIHVPLTLDGPHPSYKMIDRVLLEKLRKNVVLINAGRGEVIDDESLLHKIKSDSSLKVALDVWNSEPNICEQLMDAVSISTPHVAGYSVDGKVAGTTMIFESFLSWLGEPKVYDGCIDLESTVLNLSEESTLADYILASYDVLDDDRAMRSLIGDFKLANRSISEAFDILRKDYPLRRDFGGITVRNGTFRDGYLLDKRLMSLGFSIQSCS